MIERAQTCARWSRGSLQNTFHPPNFGRLETRLEIRVKNDKRESTLYVGRASFFSRRARARSRDHALSEDTLRLKRSISCWTWKIPSGRAAAPVAPGGPPSARRPGAARSQWSRRTGCASRLARADACSCQPTGPRRRRHGPRRRPAARSWASPSDTPRTQTQGHTATPGPRAAQFQEKMGSMALLSLF